MALDEARRKELLLDIQENQLLNDFFSHPGCEVFTQKVLDALEHVSNLNNVETLEKLHNYKGQAEVLKWFLTFPVILRDVLEEQVSEAEQMVQAARNG